MRTVTALNNQESSISRYVVFLDQSYVVGIQKSITVAVCVAILMFALFSTYIAIFLKKINSFFPALDLLSGTDHPSFVME